MRKDFGKTNRAEHPHQACDDETKMRFSRLAQLSIYSACTLPFASPFSSAPFLADARGLPVLFIQPISAANTNFGTQISRLLGTASKECRQVSTRKNLICSVKELTGAS
jgi:hypothetical protein